MPQAACPIKRNVTVTDDSGNYWRASATATLQNLSMLIGFRM